MATLADTGKEISVKIKILALVVKENETNLLRGKENKLMKQEFIEKLLGEINDLKHQGAEIILDNKISFQKVEE